MTNDADRKAMVLALGKYAWGITGRKVEGEDFAAGFTAGLAHARQPGEPVASEVLDTLIHAVEIIRDVEKDTNYSVDDWMTPEAERFTSKAQAIIDRAKAPPTPLAVPDGLWERQAKDATSVIAMIRAMIGEMFGPIASIESEDATLLRGPEAKHDGEAILEALGRVRDALSAAPIHPAGGDVRGLREALELATQQEFSMARRMRAAIVEARRRLAKGRALWNGPCVECDAVLEEALRADCPVRHEHDKALAALPAEPVGEEAKIFPQDFEPESGWPNRPRFGDVLDLKDGRTGRVEMVGAVTYGLRMENGEFVSVHHDAVATQPAAPQPGGAVKVKALTWKDGPSHSGMQVAECVFGEYWAWDAGSGCWSRGSLPGRLVSGGMKGAQAAAQADYERRILSALEPSPSQWNAGAEAPGWDCIGDAVNAVRQAIDAQQVRSNRIEQALATVIVNLKRTKDYNDTVPAIIKWWEEEEMPRIRALATPKQGGV